MAATPITCAQLASAGYDLVYFGFTGSSTDTFAMAGSNDGIQWHSMGGTWPTCGNGTPCLVNSPSAVEYTDSTTNVCHVYLLLAEANDSSLNSTYQDIGVLNTDYSVTTLLTFSWASLGSVQTIFAGRWDQVSGSTNCFVTPVSFISGDQIFDTYAACASLTPTSASITSGPTAVTISGIASGWEPGYDPQIIEYSGTCYLVQTERNTANNIAATTLSSGSCPNGPFTWQTNSYAFMSPLAYQIGAVSSPLFAEGPNYLQTFEAGSWYFWFEDRNQAQLYWATCSPLVLTSCVIGVPQKWVQDKQYRAGTILRVTSAPLPSTTINSGVIDGGTWQ